MTDLVESDPVPRAGFERLQRTVDDHGIDVCAPVSLWLELHQRCLVHLPQLDTQKQRYTKSQKIKCFNSAPGGQNILETAVGIRVFLTSSVKTPITGL